MIPWAHPSPQPKRHLDRFCRFCTDDRRVSLYFTMGRPFPLPQKNAPSHGRSGSPYNAWYAGPTRVLNPSGISIDSAVFAGLTSVSDRQSATDTQTERQTTLLGRIRYDTIPCLWNQLLSSFRQLRFSPSVSVLPVHAPTTSSHSANSPSVTPSVFHSRLKTYLFHKSFPSRTPF